MAKGNTNKTGGAGPMASTGSGPKGYKPGQGGSKVDGAHSGHNPGNQKHKGSKGPLKKDDPKGKMNY